MQFILSDVGIADATKYVNENLADGKPESKEITKAVLLTEEFLIKLKEEGECEGKVDVRIAKKFGKTKIRISAKGKEIRADVDSGVAEFLDEEDVSPSAEMAIRNLLISAQSDVFTLRYKNGINKIEINAADSERSGLRLTIAAFVAAIVLGLLFRLTLPTAVITALNTYVLIPVKTMFLNALKMIIGPMVFFSIAACIGTFSDLKELGKIGIKVMGYYISTSVLAVVIAFLVFIVIKPGTFGQLMYMIGDGSTAEAESINFIDSIVNIVPDNMFNAFADMDILQIIFIGIIVGIATAGLGQYTEKVSTFLNCGNELFVKIASMITKYIWLIIFVSICSLVMTIDVSIVRTIGIYILSVLIADILVVLIYLLIVSVFAKTNPIEFMKNAGSAWINAFSLSSSNAAMSHTFEVCENKLHIQRKLYSFAIPLGTTINMDGLCVLLGLSTLFFAKVFGVEMTATDIAAMIFSISLLSAATPGIAGGGMVCFAVLVAQFGLPAEALSIFVAIYALLDPIGTANNVIGDVTGTYTIARRNGYMQE